MEAKFIKDLLPDIAEDTLQAILTENQKDVSEIERARAALETERNGLKEQLTTANTEIQSYKDMDIDGIKQKATDWETKYNTDTQALQQQLQEQAYGYAVDKAIGGVKFSSTAAKKAFTADLKAKALKLEDGKLLGLDDYVKAYKEMDPDAFAAEEDAPHIVSRTRGGGGGGFSAALRAAMGLENKKD